MHSWNTSSLQNQPVFPPAAQTPLPQAGQMWQPDPTSPPLPATYADRVPEPMESGVRYNSANNMRGSRTAAMMYSKPMPDMQTSKYRRSNDGLFVAGLCVIIVDLFLFFLYFIFLELTLTI